MAEDELAQIIAFLRSRQGRELSHVALEATLNERGRELMRVLFQAQVDSRGPGPAAEPVCGADGVERREQRRHERGLSTVFGEVRINRLGYGAAGVASLHPLDAQLNLPAGEYSLGVRRLAAESAAQVSFEATVEALTRQTGKTMGKRQVEDLVQRAAVDFDAFYTQHEAEPVSSSILALSADGKGVVMLARDLREPTRRAAQGKANKLAKRLAKGEKRNRKRMATVAAVYTVAPYVRTPERWCAAWHRGTSPPRRARRSSTSGYGRAWKRSPRRCSRKPSARPCGAIRNGRRTGWAWSTVIRPSWICSTSSPASTRCN